MPGPKRSLRERTDEWASIKQWTLWPEQTLYEEIRPIILCGQTPGERAKEIDAAQRTLSRKADEFEKDGMQSLFATQEPRNQKAERRHQYWSADIRYIEEHLLPDPCAGVCDHDL
jgi:hypothetical protein